MMKDIHFDVKGQTEDALQQKCYFWFWNEFPHLRGLLFAVPNGAFLRNNKEGTRLRLTGLVPGVSDLIFLYQTKAYLIELKKAKSSSQTREQKIWQKSVENNGFDYFVVRSLVDFKRLIIQLVY